MTKAERLDIIEKINNQKVLDNDKLTIIDRNVDPLSKGFNFKNISKACHNVVKGENKDTPLKMLYEKLDGYFVTLTAESLNQVQTAKENYNRLQPNDKRSTKLENLIGDLEANNQKFTKIESRLNDIQSQVNTAIRKYLTKFDKGETTDNTHKPKVAVMKAIKAYVQNPVKETWNDVVTATQENAGWDKGVFSKVRFMMTEASKVHEEQDRNEQEISTSCGLNM